MLKITPPTLWQLWPEVSPWSCLWRWNMSALLWTWEKNTWQGVGAQRWKPSSNHKKGTDQEKGTIHNILQLKENCAAKTTRRGEEHPLEILQRMRACWGQPFLQEFDWVLACVASNFFMIAGMLTSANSCRCIWQTRTLNLLPPPPQSPYLALCDFFLFPHLKKCHAGRRLTQDHSQDQPFSNVFHMYPR